MSTKLFAADNPDRLLTREELGARLNVSRATTYRLETKGILPPPILIGSMKRWNWQEVKSTLPQHKNTPTAADMGEGI